MIINHKEFWYLSTPYTKYEKGQERAYEDACKQAAILTDLNIPIFCPIAMAHGIEKCSRVKWGHDFALSADMPFLNLCTGVIVCMLDGWTQSDGVLYEVEHAKKNLLPVILMEPFVAPPELVEYYKI